jgi:RNA polymerase sigma-70 factor (ECF subfamily)
VGNRQHAVEEHIAALRRYAFVLVGNSADADDLVQECLTKALDKVRLWKEIDNVRAFLFTIMHNLHVDWLRKKSNGHATVPIDSLSEHEIVSHPRQLAAVELTELAWAMKRLPREQRQTLALVCIDGMTYREVAEVTNVPLGTVMSRLSRGRESLRRLTGEIATPAPGRPAQPAQTAAHRTDQDQNDKISRTCA